MHKFLSQNNISKRNILQLSLQGSSMIFKDLARYLSKIFEDPKGLGSRSLMIQSRIQSRSSEILMIFDQDLWVLIFYCTRLLYTLIVSVVSKCVHVPLFFYSNTYWGEYPLSFAASLGLEDMVRYLLVKGACPNKQDTNGNTVLHMMVIHNRMVWD